MKVKAKRVFNYNGYDLEAGEVFELAGCRNDEKLLTYGFLDEVKGESGIIHCTCGKKFMEELNYQRHLQSDRHPKGAVVLSSEWSGTPKVKRKKKKAQKVSVA